MGITRTAGAATLGRAGTATSSTATNVAVNAARTLAGLTRPKRKSNRDGFGRPQRTLNGRATLLNVLDEPGGREQFEQRVVTTQDCGGDELSAQEPEDVAVPRVAGRDPHAFVAGHRTDERQQVLREPEDPRTAVRHVGQVAEQLDEER